jgi:hypothetical protein
MRAICLIIAAFLSIAATMPTPPAALAPYIHDGVFDPGDYGWMRARFDGASPADQTASDSIQQWLKACDTAGKDAMRAKLRAMGIADAELTGAPVSDPLCTEAGFAPYLPDVHSWAEFQRDVAAARPVVGAYLLAVRRAEEIGGPRGPTLADALLARKLGEQMLRFGMTWGEGEMKDAPPLSPDVKAIVVARLAAATMQRDHANTEWLKAIVAKQGWPRISVVGERAAGAAWLLVQHADADPAFQLRVLRLMKPLIAINEVSKKDYAYLYDRVMLKLTGKQLYATQMRACANGRRQPQPLDDPPNVDARRKAMGLDSLADYEEQMTKLLGPCPAESLGHSAATP